MAKKKAAANPIQLSPPADKLLVANTYTAYVETDEPVVQFVTPSGRAIPAAIYKGRARGTFLVQAAGDVTVSFTADGKTIAEATWPTYTG